MIVCEKNTRRRIALLVLPLCLAGCPAPEPDAADGVPQPYPGKGAAVPFITCEAEEAVYAGIKITGKAYRSLAGEASGKAAVQLNSNGSYVEFTLPRPANALVLRYAMPDSTGNGESGTLSVLADGVKINDLPTSSKHAAIYGQYPFQNNPAAGGGRIRFYDDARLLLDKTYPEGTKIGFRKDDSTAWYVIDLAEFEMVPPPLPQPANTVSITDYGAVGNDSVNCRVALVSAINAARNSGRAVWIPQGTFRVNWEGNINANGVNIYGAGMWYSTLSGSPYFFAHGSGNHFKDFAIFGDVRRRVDSDRHCAIEIDSGSNAMYENLWLEHVKCGFWISKAKNITIRNSRIRNTYADGINIAQSSSGVLAEHNDMRNHGDDGIAINSENGHHNTNNAIINNTVRLTYHASLLAVYGGGDNTLRDNLLCDTIAYGSAINISSRFNPQGFAGTTTVTGNVALRSGSSAADSERYKNSGAIWLVAWDKDFGGGTISITGNRLIDCLYDGITFDGNRAINSALSFRNNCIEGAAGYGVLIHGGNNLSGSASFANTTVSGAASGAFANNRGVNFTVANNGGNSW